MFLDTYAVYIYNYIIYHHSYRVYTSYIPTPESIERASVNATDGLSSAGATERSQVGKPFLGSPHGSLVGENF